MPEAEHFLYKHTIPSRVAKLERDVTRLKEGQTRQEDLLETIAASLVELHKKIDEKFDAQSSRMDTMDSRMDKMDARMNKMDKRMDSMEVRLTRIEQTMVTKFEFHQLLNWLDNKFASIEARLPKA